MPASATHITVLEMVANSSPEMKALLGDVNINSDNEFDEKIKFAKLGSIGPDFLYALGDFGDTLIANKANLQLYEEFLIRSSGTLACLSELMEQTNTFIDGSIDLLTIGIYDKYKKTVEAVTKVANEAVLASRHHLQRVETCLMGLFYIFLLVRELP